MDIKGKIKDLDWKKLFLEKGEKIGLGVAGAFALLMLLPFLWYMVLGNGPSANAKQLEEPTATLATKQKNSQPGDADKPPPGQTEVVVRDLRIDNPEPYRVAQLTSGSASDPNKRKQPEIFAPVEAEVAIERVQIPVYVFADKKLDKIAIARDIKDAPPKNTGDKKAPKSPYGQYARGMQPPGMGSMSAPGGGGGPGGMMGRPGRPGGGSGGPGGMMGGPPGFGPPPLLGGGEGLKGELKFEFIDVAKFDPQVQKPQEKILPLREVEIAASFPYRQQMEEFQRKLNLANYAAVTADVSGELDASKTAMPAFRFLEVMLERQTLDDAGNPYPTGTPGDWEKIDLHGRFKYYRYLNGKRMEDEPPALEAISFEGLVMHRLKSTDPNQYPRIEETLSKLKETLAEIEKRSIPASVAPKNPLKDDDEFNVFSGSGEKTEASGGGRDMGPGGPGGKSPPAGSKYGPPGGGPGGGPGGFPKPPMPGGGGAGTGDGRGAGGPGPGGDGRGAGGPGSGGDVPGTSASDGLPPDYCLVRVVDLTVYPGVTYRYRMRVKMANPNKGLKNVLSPKYAQEPFLLSDWYEIPQNVVVPPEVFFYAVDQKDPLVEPKDKDYKGQNFDYPIQKERQAVFQMHKWVEAIPLVPNDNRQIVEIGEWVVAERVPVFRGEFLGRNQRVQTPVWKSSHEAFVMMTDPKNPQGQRFPGVPVNFSQPDGSDLVLVDFEGGEVKYDRGGKSVVTEKAGTETMVLAPDGKLLVHDSASDNKDAERVKRLEAYRKRVKDVKAGKSDKGDTSNPFGGGGGGGSKSGGGGSN